MPRRPMYKIHFPFYPLFGRSRDCAALSLPLIDRQFRAPCTRAFDNGFSLRLFFRRCARKHGYALRLHMHEEEGEGGGRGGER